MPRLVESRSPFTIVSVSQRISICFVHPEDLELAEIKFNRLDYRPSESLTFKSTNLTLHRFVKIEPDEKLVVAILVANEDNH